MSDIIKMFWSKLEFTGECRLWTGCVNNKGYGIVTFNRERWYVHRLSWFITNGRPDPGVFICHKCDNPPCVNPHHLFAGNNLINMRDAQRKGRQAKKLTVDSVIEMRRKYSDGEATQEQLAEEFGVTQSTVWAIIYRRAWAHVI